MIVDPTGTIEAEAETIGEEIVTAVIPIAEFRTEENRYSPLYHNPHMPLCIERGGVRTELIVPIYEQHPGQFPPNLLTKYQKEHHGELPPDCPTTRKWYFKHARWNLQYHDPAE